MILRPQALDLRIIAHYLGQTIVAFGLSMVLPVIAALLFHETVPIIDFAIGVLTSLCAGFLLINAARLPRDTEMTWMHGMVIVSIVWVVCMFLAAIPLYLSGHWKSYLDACFEAMSGLATTGLVLIQDLDHLSHAANLWRHMLMFLGGQGIIIVALTFLIKAGPGAFRLYVGEARDEKILPNVVETARFIWFVSLVYFIIGSAILSIVGIVSVGMPVREAVFHGVCNFMSAFDTAGFTPNSQSILFYQSFLYECATIIIMVWGTINFNLHYAVWNGRRMELWRDIEIRIFLISMAVTSVLLGVAFMRSHIYSDPVVLLRRGLYQLISGHTTTGYQTIYARQFITEWDPLSLLALIVAMGFGASACSTSGGIKMLRIGIIAKAFKEDVKRFLTSGSAVVTVKFRHLRDLFLDDKLVRSASLITLAYIVLYLVGSVVGCFYGYPFLNSVFESVSAGANVGLSCGITQASMPAALKITYIIQMWAGRLEFLSILVLGAFIVSFIKGK